MTEPGFDDLAMPQAPGGAPPGLPPEGAPVPKAAPRTSFLEWITRRNALGLARLATTPSPTSLVRLRQAAAEFELADRILDPAEPLRSGSSAALALDGYRRAAFWALASRVDGPTPRDMVGMLADPARPPPAGAELTPTGAELTATGTELMPTEAPREILLRSFVDDAELADDRLRQDALTVRAFAITLIDRGLGPAKAVNTLLFQRLWRSVLTVGTSLLLVVGALVAIRMATLKPNIAQGKAWRTSSEEFKCHPEVHECSGSRMDILFHTKDEESPWFELDLGKSSVFSTVEVTNRSDCCGDRAIPAVIEISDDRVRWTEVARRTDPFSLWRATFPKRSARYVRVRVLRRSILHLEGVAVR